MSCPQYTYPYPVYVTPCQTGCGCTSTTTAETATSANDGCGYPDVVNNLEELSGLAKPPCAKAVTVLGELNAWDGNTTPPTGSGGGIYVYLAGSIPAGLAYPEVVKGIGGYWRKLM